MLLLTGDIKLVIAAKVDVRDGLAWSSLDKYIKNIEGGGPGASGLQAHPSDDAAAAVTAAGVADSEEDPVDPGTSSLFAYNKTRLEVLQGPACASCVRHRVAKREPSHVCWVGLSDACCYYRVVIPALLSCLRLLVSRNMSVVCTVSGKRSLAHHQQQHQSQQASAALTLISSHNRSKSTFRYPSDEVREIKWTLTSMLQCQCTYDDDCRCVGVQPCHGFHTNKRK